MAKQNGDKKRRNRAAMKSVVKSSTVKKPAAKKSPVIKPKKKKVGLQGNGGGKKRNKLNASKDRIEIIEHYLSGKNYRDIAKLISDKRDYNISHVTVGNDVKVVLEEWKVTREDKVELYLTIELAKIDKIEREYWKAWEKSKVNYKQKSNKSQEGTTSKGFIQMEEESKKDMIEYGDPRFLQGVERCVQKRIDIFGLESAKTFTIKTISETTVFRVKNKELDNVKMKVAR